MDKLNLGQGSPGASKALCCQIGILWAATEIFDVYAADGNPEQTLGIAKKLFGVPDVKIMY